MRRIAVALALMGCLLVSGCRKEVALPQTTSFSCAVLFSCGDFSATADVTRDGVGQLTVTCTSPPTLAGLRVVQSGNAVRLSQNGMEMNLPPESLPNEAMFLRLCRILDTVALDSNKKAGSPLQGIYQDEPYTLEYDLKTGNLTKLSVPNCEFSVEFSDFYSSS